MKVVQINPVCYSSTGKIAVELSKILTSRGIENYILYTLGDSDYDLAIKYSQELHIKTNAFKAKVLGNYGFNSYSMTKRVINELKRIEPDVVHLHNLHGHNVNLKMLFDYLKSIDVKIIWTFHDCWVFTGYCMYFDYAKCNKWQTQCKECPQRKKYSWFLDKSKVLFERKKEIFSEINDLTIVTPSKWLAGLTKQSILSDYPVAVINNGINLDVFKPVESDFRQKYGLNDKRIILGVAMDFDKRKGFEYFLKLAEKIDDNTRIVLVGTSEMQNKMAPENVICISRTANQNELAQIYTAADVFLNCTLEDNFPTVNLEALACGTPVITFNTGGSIECIDNNDVGVVVDQGDIDGIIAGVEQILSKENIACLCREKAVLHYNAEKCFEQYLDLYNISDA